MAKQENVYWPSDEETKIVPVEIVDEIKGSMLQYSMSVLVGRAIPDGGHRQPRPAGCARRLKARSQKNTLHNV